MKVSVFMFGSAASCSHAAARALLESGSVRFLGFCWSRPQRMSWKERALRLIGNERILTTQRHFRDPAPGVPSFDRNDLQTVQTMLDSECPDLILSCGFPKLIPGRILEAGRHAINIHPGLLPQRPGGTPVRWAVRLGDPTYGVTAHYMTDRFDAGDIVLQKTIALSMAATTGEAEAALEPDIAETTISIVQAIQGGGQFNRRPQDATPSMPSMRGRRQFVNWQTDDAASIRRLCHAMRPRSGGLARWGTKTVVLWDVEPRVTQVLQAEPGTVCGLTPEGPVVATSGGSIAIRSALIGGRVREGNALRLRLGDRLS